MSVKTESMVSPKSRKWLSGKIESRTYFDEAYREARASAKADVMRRVRMHRRRKTA